MPYDAIVTSHLNPYLSGVAKFNQVLAQKLGVPCLSLAEAGALECGRVLLSVKFAENCEEDLGHAERFLAQVSRHPRLSFDVFFHAFEGLTGEHKLVDGASKVLAGNHELAAVLSDLGRPLETLWCPELLDLSADTSQHALQLFSFGMAHKVQIRYYEMLRDLLESNNIDYMLMVSTAFHEKANFGEIDEISQGFGDVFGDRVRLLGFLSDAAVNLFLARTDLFVAFFRSGVRANNTSVYAAMASGCPVLTNLDGYSPEWMVHESNVLDIHSLETYDFDKALLRQIGHKAKADADRFAGWQRLVDILSQ